jgi:hypothetical protein
LSAGGTVSYFDYRQGTLQTDNNNPAKAGFNGGIKLDIPVSGHSKSFTTSMAPELFLIQNGANNQYYTTASLSVDSITKINLDYIGLYLPVKFRYQPDSGSAGLYLLAAGFIDYVAGSSAGNSTADGSIGFNSGGDKTDFGFRGGFGVIFPRNGNKVTFSLEIGYNKGLNKIQFYNPANPATKNSPDAINNNGFTISLTAFF